MAAFVTGATGFIGRYLVRELLARGPDDPDLGEVLILVRPGSHAKLAELRAWWGPDAQRVSVVEGDLREPGLGVQPRDVARLRGQLRHFFHLGAIYDLDASAESLAAANVAGTRHALELARALAAGCFHLCSSIAAAGDYRGVFTEDMFEQATGLEHPYFRTKHEAEAIVRAQSHTPFRIYRPGMVVGDSETGHITKVDGPYYFFKPLQRLRSVLPPWFPLIGLQGGYANVVPVDYVAKAMLHLARVPEQDGRCFQLVDPHPRRMGELLNLFAKAAHAPAAKLRLDLPLRRRAPAGIAHTIGRYAPLRSALDDLLGKLRVPRAALAFLDMPTEFDNARTRALLEPAGITLPPLENYAWRLWDYWERRLDPDLYPERTLHRALRDKRVLITGAAAGIGYATALRLCDTGARLLIVDRAPQALASARVEIERRGARVSTYLCDLSDETARTQLIAQIETEHGGVDVLINNAGRSIRRSLDISCQRFFDYERLMAVNYFAAVRLTLAFLPGMAARRSGHVVSISSIGVLTAQPRFSAYIASKAALEAFTRSAAGEYRDRGVRFTVINFPLVRTAMVAPTRGYAQLPMLSPEQAAQRVLDALVRAPSRMVTPIGRLGQLAEAFAPQLTDVVNNTSFHMFPDSAAARGVDAPEAPTAAASDFTRWLSRVHWG